ncbi:MAG TPA: helicase-related protein [Thermotogota bacterium]|nr:helicase-related protein [Thermotogota bacterium]HRW93760.1 helicase-related protein [Thermotogota bacterium]
MNESTIRDNFFFGTVGSFLKEAVSAGSSVSIVSAYFTIFAYHSLKKNFNGIRGLRFLFGEPTFIQSVNPEKLDPKGFRIEDDHISLENRLSQKSVARECSQWIREKVEIRSLVRPKFLHGKLYHVHEQSGVERAIAGSSNFTVNGLGLGGNKNIELNLVIDSDRERRELVEWFDKIWSDSGGLVEDVKERVLEYLEQLHRENSPEFVYFKTLFHIFGDYLAEQKQEGLIEPRTGFFDSQIWEALYDFQKDGVKGAINKILKHNGCIIADSVGLGKTFEALAIIKYFELLNQRVLVICPKKLAGNWTIYQARQNHSLNPFPKDRFDFSVLCHTDMGREKGKSKPNGIDLETFNWGAYDLVVIDESHNFRGNPLKKEREDGSIHLNRAGWLMEKIIKSGVRTKVLMLSATPVNNNLRDLRNQIAFITEGKDDALWESCKIRDISQALKNTQTRFTQWADPKKNSNRSVKKLLETLDSAFFKLLDEITIARSRKHILNFYQVEKLGKFPERRRPIPVYPQIDRQGRFPSYDRVNRQILEYKLSIFNPSAYVLADQREKYEELAGTKIAGFRQSEREFFLINMMKTNYLKRLESSIHSFSQSLERTLEKIESLETKIRDFQEFRERKSNESLDEFIPDENELEENEDEIQAWQVGKKLRFNLADIDLERWKRDLEKDREALVDLFYNACAVTPARDAKLAKLKSLILEKVSNPINTGNKKLLIFTAFADTARYLYENIQDWCQKDLGLHCARVCGSDTETTLGRNVYDEILLNFSPVSKNRHKYPGRLSETQEEIDILVATDCISEGQNLQDCDTLVNYDIHWNPVRIIQRFGRIDRLGSKNQAIQLINFWPTEDLDNYINLKERVEARMALVDVTATGEENILNPDQLHELIEEDLKFRNRQLKKLQHEILDLEELEDSISFSDFTLDDFRVELLKYLETKRESLEKSPDGLYALVPGESFPKGVIFCLVQKNPSEGNEKVNPLNPYFLVYVQNDGTIRANYTAAKKVLETFRTLCQNKTQPLEDLCRDFNAETSGGKEMGRYSFLLRKAVNGVVQVFHKRSNRHLQFDRTALLTQEQNQVNHLDDFELVTWLIVR